MMLCSCYKLLWYITGFVTRAPVVIHCATPGGVASKAPRLTTRQSDKMTHECVVSKATRMVSKEIVISNAIYSII